MKNAHITPDTFEHKDMMDKFVENLEALLIGFIIGCVVMYFTK